MRAVPHRWVRTDRLISTYLVNVARGSIVDGDVLLDALNASEIAGAGLGVFPDEPPAFDDLLRDHEQVIATPHIAWYLEEVNEDRRRTVAAGSLGEDLPDVRGSNEIGR